MKEESASLHYEKVRFRLASRRFQGLTSLQSRSARQGNRELGGTTQKKGVGCGRGYFPRRGLISKAGRSCSWVSEGWCRVAGGLGIAGTSPFKNWGKVLKWFQMRPRTIS